MTLVADTKSIPQIRFVLYVFCGGAEEFNRLFVHSYEIREVLLVASLFL